MFYSPTSSTLYHHSKALCLRTRTCQAPCCRQAHHTGADDNHSRRTLLALAPPCAKLKDAPFLLKSFDTLHSLPVPRPSQHKQLLVNMWRCMANQNTRLRRLPAKKKPTPPLSTSLGNGNAIAHFDLWRHLNETEPKRSRMHVLNLKIPVFSFSARSHLQ